MWDMTKLKGPYCLKLLDMICAHKGQSCLAKYILNMIVELFTVH